MLALADRSKHYSMRSRFISMALGSLCGLCVLCSVIIAGCEEAGTVQAKKIWGFPPRTLERRLASGNWEFLKHLDYDTVDLRQVADIMPGASYYLALIYSELELAELSTQMMVQEWRLGSDPWRRLAGMELMRGYAEEEHYGRLERTARRGIGSYPSNVEYNYHLLEALYWQKRDSELLERLPQFQELIAYEQETPYWRVRPLSSESTLWQAVAAERADTADWPQQFRRLFTDFSASEYQQRLFLYLNADEGRRGRFTKWELHLFAAKHLLAGRDYQPALVRIEQALDAIGPDHISLLFNERTLRDIGLIYFRAGRRTAGIERLRAMLPQIEEPMAQSVTLEWIGRLQQVLGRYEEAAESFAAGFEAAASDRLLWLHLNALLNVAPDKLVSRLATHAQFIEQPGYFTDLLDRLASRLVAETEWRLAWETLVNIDSSASARDQARFAVIVGEAERTGRLRLDSSAERLMLGTFLTKAQSQTESSYYSLLAGLLANGAVQLSAHVVTVPTDNRRSGRASVNRSDATNDCPRLIEGYLYFGLKPHAYRAALACGDELPTTELVKLAKEMQIARMFRETLVLIERARRRSDFVPSPEALRLIYPRAFAETIDGVVRRYELPQALFYALVREESYFAPAVVSHAGAVGLAQLMPATAADVASRMGIDSPVLTEPAVNLDIGGFHFRMLLDLLDEQPVYALSAYNAGIGRMRRWLSQRSWDSQILFHEAIPFAETRHYARKILVSGAWYASLYANVPPEEFVRGFFPDIGYLQ